MKKPDRVLALRTDRIIYQYGECCVKVYSRSHTCTDVLLEAGNMAAAKEAGVRTPELIEVTKTEEGWALVTGFVPGETLSQLIMSGDIAPDECLAALVKTQMEMQSADAGLFRGLKEELFKSVSRSPLSGPVKEHLTDMLGKLEDGSALCHGNMVPENVLLEENNIKRPVILDWKRACRGSACADAAAAWIYLELSYGKESARKYLQQYCGACGISRKDIMRWVPVMAASRLSGSNRRERKALLSIIDELFKDGGGSLS